MPRTASEDGHMGPVATTAAASSASGCYGVLACTRGRGFLNSTLYIRKSTCYQQCSYFLQPADFCCSCFCFKRCPCSCCACCDLRRSVCCAATWQFLVGGLLGSTYATVTALSFSVLSMDIKSFALIIHLLVFWWLYFLCGIVGCCTTLDRQGILTYDPRAFFMSRMYMGLNLLCAVCHITLAVLNDDVWGDPLSRLNIFLTFLPLAWDWYIIYLAWSLIRKLKEQRKGIFQGWPVMHNQRKPGQLLELHSGHNLALSPPPNQTIVLLTLATRGRNPGGVVQGTATALQRSAPAVAHLPAPSSDTWRACVGSADGNPTVIITLPPPLEYGMERISHSANGGGGGGGEWSDVSSDRNIDNSSYSGRLSSLRHRQVVDSDSIVGGLSCDRDDGDGNMCRLYSSGEGQQHGEEEVEQNSRGTPLLVLPPTPPVIVTTSMATPPRLSVPLPPMATPPPLSVPLPPMAAPPPPVDSAPTSGMVLHDGCVSGGATEEAVHVHQHSQTHPVHQQHQRHQQHRQQQQEEVQGHPAKPPLLSPRCRTQAARSWWRIQLQPHGHDSQSPKGFGVAPPSHKTSGPLGHQHVDAAEWSASSLRSWKSFAKPTAPAPGTKIRAATVANVTAVVPSTITSSAADARLAPVFELRRLSTRLCLASALPAPGRGSLAAAVAAPGAWAGIGVGPGLQRGGRRRGMASVSRASPGVGQPRNPPLTVLDPVRLSVPAGATYGSALFHRAVEATAAVCRGSGGQGAAGLAFCGDGVYGGGDAGAGSRGGGSDGIDEVLAMPPVGQWRRRALSQQQSSRQLSQTMSREVNPPSERQADVQAPTQGRTHTMAPILAADPHPRAVTCAQPEAAVKMHDPQVKQCPEARLLSMPANATCRFAASAGSGADVPGYSRGDARAADWALHLASRSASLSTEGAAATAALAIPATQSSATPMLPPRGGVGCLDAAGGTDAPFTAAATVGAAVVGLTPLQPGGRVCTSLANLSTSGNPLTPMPQLPPPLTLPPRSCRHYHSDDGLPPRPPHHAQCQQRPQQGSTDLWLQQQQQGAFEVLLHDRVPRPLRSVHISNGDMSGGAGNDCGCSGGGSGCAGDAIAGIRRSSFTIQATSSAKNLRGLKSLKLSAVAGMATAPLSPPLARNGAAMEQVDPWLAKLPQRDAVLAKGVQQAAAHPQTRPPVPPLPLQQLHTATALSTPTAVHIQHRGQLYSASSYRPALHGLSPAMAAVELQGATMQHGQPLQPSHTWQQRQQLSATDEASQLAPHQRLSACIEEVTLEDRGKGGAGHGLVSYDGGNGGSYAGDCIIQNGGQDTAALHVKHPDRAQGHGPAWGLGCGPRGLPCASASNLDYHYRTDPPLPATPQAHQQQQQQQQEQCRQQLQQQPYTLQQHMRHQRQQHQDLLSPRASCQQTTSTRCWRQQQQPGDTRHTGGSSSMAGDSGSRATGAEQMAAITPAWSGFAARVGASATALWGILSGDWRVQNWEQSGVGTRVTTMGSSHATVAGLGR